MGKSNNPDGIRTFLITEEQLQTYAQGNADIAQMQAPQVLDSNNPHQRLFVANLDGTGNNMDKEDPSEWTNVAKIHEQLRGKIKIGELPNIGTGYVPGPGTQGDDLAAKWDLATGYTFERRVETAYAQFIDWAGDQLDKDPNAQISVLSVGFSRGGEHSSALNRLIDERGIQDPEGATYKRDKNNFVMDVSYSKPPLVPPGQTAQIAVFMDPVGTGEPRQHDRRPPPSVIGALQLTALEERRDLFKSSNLIDPGLHEDNRFGNIGLVNSHSGLGGGYHANGLAILTFNMAANYINALSDKPILALEPEPKDRSLYVVHRSDDHSVFYSSLSMMDGERNRKEQIAPAERMQSHGPKAAPSIPADEWARISNKEPHDTALASQFVYRNVVIEPAPLAPIKDSPLRTHMGVVDPADNLNAWQQMPRFDAPTPSPAGPVLRMTPHYDDNPAKANISEPSTVSAPSMQEQIDAANRIAREQAMLDLQAQQAAKQAERERLEKQTQERQDADRQREREREESTRREKELADKEQELAQREKALALKEKELAAQQNDIETRQRDPQAKTSQAPEQAAPEPVTAQPSVSRAEPAPEPLKTFPRDHPDYPLYQKLREQLPPEISNEKVAETAMLVKDDYFFVEDIQKVEVYKDRIYIDMSNGEQVSSRIDDPAPSMEATIEKIHQNDLAYQEWDRAMDIRLAQIEAMNPNPPFLSLTHPAMQLAGADGDGGAAGGGGDGG